MRSLRIGGILTDEALLRLTDTTFTRLCLASCRLVSGDSLCHLKLLCPVLMSLDLSWCVQLRAADIDGALMPSLRALSLRGCFRLEATCVCAALAKLAHLATLRIDEQLPLAQGAWSIGSLTILEVSAGPADASALCHALRSPVLQVLVLRDASGLDDTHVRLLLAGLPALDHLDLRSTNSTQLRASFLLTGPGSATLRTLRLHGDGIGSVDSQRQSGEGGGMLGGLTSSALSGLAVIGGSPALGAFSRALSMSAAARGPSFAALRRLDLRGTRLQPPFVRSALAAMPKLDTLELGTGRCGTSARWALAEEGGLIGTPLPRLRALSIGRTALGPGLAAELVEYCPRLQSLRLVRCRGFGAAFVATLRPLMGDSNGEIADEIEIAGEIEIAARSRREHLARFELVESEVAAEELEDLSSVLPAHVDVLATMSSTLSELPASVLPNLRAPPSDDSIERQRMRAWVPELVRRDAWSAALWADEIEGLRRGCHANG